MQTCVPFVEASQVGEARRTAVGMSRGLSLTESRRGDLAIIATELATNLSRHAQSGRLLMQTIPSGGADYFEIIAVDGGPGIPDLHRSMQDGYSTGGTAGTGFGAVRRMSDEFDAFSTVGKGTVVVARVRVDGDAPSLPFAVGASCLAAPHETVCGDTWRVSADRDRIAVMVADGLGHGPGAHEASARATGVFDRAPFSDDAACSAAYSSCVRRKIRMRFRGLVIAMGTSMGCCYARAFLAV